MTYIYVVFQWIGNAVTISWWDDLWIQEGLTTYLENKGVDHVYSSWNVTVYDHAYYLYAALDNDQLGSSPPLYKSLMDISYQLEDIFSLLTYYKVGVYNICLVFAWLTGGCYKLLSYLFSANLLLCRCNIVPAREESVCKTNKTFGSNHSKGIF